jgi:hypothetical protein
MIGALGPIGSRVSAVPNGFKTPVMMPNAAWTSASSCSSVSSVWVKNRVSTCSSTSYPRLHSSATSRVSGSVGCGCGCGCGCGWTMS